MVVVVLVLVLSVFGGAAAAVGRRRGHRRCCLLGILLTGSQTTLSPDEENSPLSHGTNGVVMRRLHVRSPHPPHTCLKVFTTSVT